MIKKINKIDKEMSTIFHKKNRRGAIALSQIFILLISIVAIGYAVGSEVGFVSAATPCTDAKCKDEECAKACLNVDLNGKPVKYANSDCVNNGGLSLAQCIGSKDIGATGACKKCCCKGTAVETIVIDKTKSTNTQSTGGQCSSLCISAGYLAGASDESCHASCGSGFNPIKGPSSCPPTNPNCCCKGVKSTTTTDTTKTTDCEKAGHTCEATCAEKDMTGESCVDASSGAAVSKGICCAVPSGKTETSNTNVLTDSLTNKFKGAIDKILNSPAFEAFAWGAMTYAIVKFLGPMLGFERDLVDAAALAAGFGVGVGQLATTLLTKKMGDAAQAQLAGAGIGAAVGIAVFIMTYRKETQETITFTCYPWDAPVGGSDCEFCNRQGLPCSEYQCRSLGQGCQIVNPGTDKEQCAWVNRDDVNPPTIKARTDVLLQGYTYKDLTEGVSPPDRGVRIWNENSTSGCVKAFTPLTFGVELNEPAKCKIDGIRKKKFDDMSFFFSNSLSLYNHSYTLSLPSPSADEAENITIGNKGKYGFYVKCQDANGNTNTADFVFAFDVCQGPDTTPPLIVKTSPLNGKPVAYNISAVENVIVYTNEPSDCKWSHLDQSYDKMDHNMTNCAQSTANVNSEGLYTCTTTLDGIKDRQENIFYIRCKDQPQSGVDPADRNANEESYRLSLIGTQPLFIDWVKPVNNSLVKDSTSPVKVTVEARTSAGYKDGEASCYYRDTLQGTTDSNYVMFYNTSSFEHSQDLWLVDGEYEYIIKCLDLGGNSDTEIVHFTVESDRFSPIVVRAYHVENYLKLITNEPAECRYDTKYSSAPCDYTFEDGTEMVSVNNTEHYTDWNPQAIFYIKCQDVYGRQPDSGCSIIIKPSDFESTL